MGFYNVEEIRGFRHLVPKARRSSIGGGWVEGLMRVVLVVDRV